MSQEIDSTKELADLYKHVCWLDMQAIKPGNVGMHSSANDLSTDDFITSAEVSAKTLVDPSLTLGERILFSLQATHNAVGTNTNLGIILLIAPLMHASLKNGPNKSLQESLANILESTTVDDAIKVYEGIRIVEPGGMGSKNNQDISKIPTVTLLETMKIASEWDHIADQYSHNYADVFSFGKPRYRDLYAKWNDERCATTGVYLGYLARFPDSLVERKFGYLKAREISDIIVPLEKELCRSDFPGRYEEQLMMIDHHLKLERINPGTSADLTVASVFTAGLNQL